MCSNMGAYLLQPEKKTNRQIWAQGQLRTAGVIYDYYILLRCIWSELHTCLTLELL